MVTTKKFNNKGETNLFPKWTDLKEGDIFRFVSDNELCIFTDDNNHVSLETGIIDYESEERSEEAVIIIKNIEFNYSE